MDWITLFSSSVIAAVISGVSALYFKKVDYNYDFKKYVLKKRIEAYEKAELLINYSNDKYFENGTKGKQVAVPRFFYNEKKSPITFDEYVTQTKKIFDYSIWFTDRFSELLLGLNNIMAEIQTELYNSPETEDKLIKLGTEYSSKINKQISLLLKQFFVDMKNLNNINEFKLKKENFTF